MPWGEVTRVSLREEFVQLAMRPCANRQELCRRFKISPKTGYKWLQRYKLAGLEALKDRSRRPHRSPRRTDQTTEQEVISLRAESLDCWGGRKPSRQLLDRGGPELAPSTITKILHRHGLIEPERSAAATPWQRFERGVSNELWQMDFKGHFALVAGARCHPLTVLDDHSRFAVLLKACTDQRGVTVQNALTSVFRRYGLPAAMLMDNGSPWGDRDLPFTGLSLWLIRLGIRVTHGRPYHPQTQGKDERFHRTLMAEVIGRRAFADLAECQRRFDQWRVVYNTQRPHEALALATPAARYRPSERCFPEKIEPFDYGPGAIVRRVDEGGWLSFRNRPIKLGRAFAYRRVALRPTDQEGCFDVMFCAHQVGALDLRQAAA